jgi:Ca2+:H+ antiporter
VTSTGARLVTLPFVLLLACFGLATALHFFAPDRHTLVFAAAAIAIIPLAGYIGHATEMLADDLGGTIGGLLNATFGNAAELIIGVLALRHGLPGLVKASITGSIIGNVLFVFGVAAVAGGWRHTVLRFNRTAASSGTTMLVLSAVGLIVPAVFHWLSTARTAPLELQLDTEIAVVLLLTYVCYLIFTLKTHRDLVGSSQHGASRRSPNMQPALILLAGATAATAYMSELLVGSLSATAQDIGLSPLFVGVIIVPIVGNAAEHYSAVTLAARNQMDAALGIAVGSSIQIALFVAPVLIFLSYAIGPEPMDLLFTVFEVAAVTLSVLVISFVAHDGETHWLEGVQLLAVYTILALGFFFVQSPPVPGR